MKARRLISTAMAAAMVLGMTVGGNHYTGG